RLFQYHSVRIRQTRPAPMSTQPTTWMLTKPRLAFTANARIAPTARRKMLPPMPTMSSQSSHKCGAVRWSTRLSGSLIRHAKDMTTSRTLVILRHAKAEAPNRAADLERSLTERGHADAGAAGAWLVARGYLPNLVICSPARRTRQTWHGVAVALAGDGS